MIAERHLPAGPQTRPWLGWPAIAALVALLCSPFLWAEIPPLVDVPGHIGGAAIASAPPGSPLRGYYHWQWAMVPNLGGEALMWLIEPLAGAERAGWWAMLLATASFALGGLATIRALNPKGSHGLGLALLFVFGFPWLWGFINFVLAAGLSMLVFALSLQLKPRAAWRAVLLIAAQPLLLTCHALGGIVLPVLVAAEALGGALDDRVRPWPALARRMIVKCWPLAAAAIYVVWWKLQAPRAPNPGLSWEWLGKLDFLMEVLRDQVFVFDVASVVACYLIVLSAAKFGAGWSWRQGLPPLAMLLVYALLPAKLDGSELVDIRFLPVAMLLALGLQDWSSANQTIRRVIFLTGAMLLIARLGVITASFVSYDARFRAELAALDHVARGSRIVSLRQQSCANVDWRMSRLDTLPALAGARREAWINAQWDVPGIHLLRSRFTPAPGRSEVLFPVVWEPRCPEADGRSLDARLGELPLQKIDYVWLIDTGEPKNLPPQLQRVWQQGRSALYQVRN